MRWSAAAKGEGGAAAGGGAGKRRVSCDLAGVFQFPVDDPTCAATQAHALLS